MQRCGKMSFILPKLELRGLPSADAVRDKTYSRSRKRQRWIGNTRTRQQLSVQQQSDRGVEKQWLEIVKQIKQ